jgi:hypothetical protein
VFRPSNGNWYIKLSNGPGNTDHQIHLHAHGGDAAPIVLRAGLP